MRSPIVPAGAFLCLVSLAAAPAPLLAAETDASAERSRVIEEILVTARRREENVQDVPAAVSAFGARELQEQQISTPMDLQKITPSLGIGGVNSVFNRSLSNYSIRGVGQGLFGGAAVTSYFAEAPFGPTGPGFPFFDIKSVQVLKGPQGTLFGRATAAGAVLIEPEVATADDIYGSINTRLGNKGRSDANLMINVPLIADELAVRIAYNRTHMDGYTRNLVTGKDHDGQNSQSVRVSLTANPTDWFSNTTIYNYLDFDVTTQARVLVGANLGLANLNRTAANFLAVCNTAVASGLATNVAACQAQRVQILADLRAHLRSEVTRTTSSESGLRTYQTSGAYDDREIFERHDFVNSTTIDLPDVGIADLGLKNIFSYQLQRNITNGTFSGTRFDLNASAFGTASQARFSNGETIAEIGDFTKTYTNETHFTGALPDDELVWILGYYYQRTPITAGVAGSTNLNRTFGGVGTPDLGPISATRMPLDGFSLETAGFGQFTAHLARVGLENVRFTAGYRKTRTEVKNTSAAAVITYPAATITPGAVTTSKTKGRGPGYTFSLDWQPTDDLLVYITRRRGYKPGGLNVIPGASAVPGFVPAFSPESVIDTEIGAKWDFAFDQVAGRVNANVFRNDYTDIQRGVNAITPAGQNIAFTNNVAEAELKGFEVEALLQIGERWTVSGSYSYIKSDYTKWLGADPLGAVPTGNIDLSNNPFANAPEHKYSITLQYQLPVPAEYGTVDVLLTVYGQDETWMSDNAQRYIEVYTGNTTVFLNGQSLKDVVSEPSYAAANARIDWGSPFGVEGLEASLFVRNLTDEVYAVAGALSLQSIGLAQKLYNEPRTYGVELTYRLGQR